MRILAATAAVMIGSSAGAVTLINGSFEDGVAIADNSFVSLSGGDTTSIVGWEVLPDGIDYIGTFWQASEGVRSLDLSALNSGGVMQRVGGFVVGKQYSMTFDVSGNPGGGDNPKRILYSVTGGEPQIYVYPLTEANSTSNMLYQTVTYTFIATSEFQEVQFRSLENNPFGTVLDNVSISLVPEPATWALLIAGFAMTGAALRRRRPAVIAA